MPRKNETQLALLTMPQEEPAAKRSQLLKSWALVELYGRQQLVKDGKVIREGFTRYVGLNSIYSLTLCTEEMVRQLLPNIDGTPGARPLTLRSYNRRDYGERW
jgi:hypothetical protein